MKPLLLKITLIVTLSSAWLVSNAQVTETFESFTTGCPQSFTNNGVVFGSNKLRVFVPGQCLNQNVNGYGVGNACVGEGCGSTSDKFFDNGGNYGMLQTYVISTAGVDFTIKSMYVFISTNGGNNPTTGSVNFVGKKAGVTIFSFTKSSWPNSSNGFSYVNFATEGGSDNSNKLIDAIEMSTAGAIDYLAVDNFKSSNLQTSYASTTVPPGLYNATSSANGNNRVVLGDFNNDGHIDMLSQFGGSGTPVTYHQNNGNGTYSSVLGTNTNPSTITSGVLSGMDFTDLITAKYHVYDFDNDGDNDIYESNSATSCRYMRSNGSSFTLSTVPTGLPTTVSPAFGRFVPGDYDNDGDIDVLFQLGTTVNNISVAINNGSGTFVETAANPTTGVFSSGIFNGVSMTNVIAPGMKNVDVDNDGDIDILQFHTSTVAPTNFYRNDGTSWANAPLPSGLPVTTPGVRYVPGDFDADGDVDVLYQPINTASVGIVLGLNNGSGAFTNISATGAGLFTSGPFNGLSFIDIFQTLIYPADYDSDGDIDLYILPNGAIGSIQYYKNGGTAPTLSSRTPLNSATGVSLNPTLSLTFSKAVFAGNSANNIYIKRFSDNVTVATVASNSANVTGSGTANITISVSGLVGGTKYYIAFDDQSFKDSDGIIWGSYNDVTKERNGYKSNSFWSFTTAASCTNPTISNQPINRTICTGANATFGVTVSGATTGFQWQVNQGAGFNNLSNTGVYSNVNTSTLGITAATSGLNGYTYRCIILNGSCSSTSTGASLSVAAIPSASITSQTNVSCNGGSNGALTVTQSGGAANFTYNWSNGSNTSNSALSTNTISSLTANTYTVTITDANLCRTTTSAIITQPAAISSGTSLLSHITNCGLTNGVATLSGNGGVGTLEYSINGTTWFTTTVFSGLSAAAYTPRVRSQSFPSCSVSGTLFTITTPSVPSISSVVDNDITNCGLSNGRVTITGTGGTGIVEYSINNINWFTTNVFTNLSANTYATFIRNQNSIACSAAGATFTITSPSAPSISNVLDSDILSCGLANGSATITGVGGTGTLEYSINNTNWFTTNVFTNLSANTYTTFIRNQNSIACSASGAGFAITVPSTPSISSVIDNDITNCSLTDGRVTIIGTGGLGTLEFSINSINWFTSNIFTGLSANTYSTYIRNQNSIACSAAGTTFTITTPSVPSISSVLDNDITNCGFINGRATVTGIGGTGIVEYSMNNTAWFTSNIFTGLGVNTYTTYIRNQNSIACSATGATFTITTPSIPTFASVIDMDITNCGLANGSATILGTGGTGALEYSINGSIWTSSNVFTSLNAATFTTYIRNANSILCSATGATFTITAPGTPIISNVVDSDITNCGLANGQATISGTGGIGTLEYSINNINWFTSNIFTGLSANTYSTYVRNQSSISCSATGSSFVITTPSVPTFSSRNFTNITNCISPNGSVTITGLGGTGTLEYSVDNSTWTTNNVIGGLSAAVYTPFIRNQSSVACSVAGSGFTLVSIPTTIVSQPVSQTICGAALTSFVVSALGDNLSYNWSNGQTSTSMQTSITGNYTVTVTGSCGTAISNAANLNVNEITQILTQPISQTICTGTTAGFAVSAIGTNLTYAWSNGQTTNAITTNNAGNYIVTVSGACGNVISDVAKLQVVSGTVINTQPTSQTICGGNTATISVAGTGAALTYLWNTGETSASISKSVAGTYTVTVTGSCGTAISNAANLNVNEITQILTQPISQTICTGTTAGFAVSAIGTNLTYAWSNGPTTNAITTNNAGNYTVTVSGACGNVISDVATLQVVSGTVINTQPTSQTICGGNTATISVAGTGAALTYLWNTGETSASISTSISGTYLVTVTGSCGTAISSEAILQVDSITTITSQPTNQVVCLNANATLAVTAIGTGTLTYLWNTQETTASINTNTVASNYQVTVTGSCGVAVSNVVAVSNATATQILSQTPNKTICGGNIFPLNVTAIGTNLTYVWNTGATTSTLGTNVSGRYTVTVTGTCGTATAAIDLIVNKITSIVTEPSNQVLVNGTANLAVSASGSNLVYVWNTGETSTSIVATSAGFYMATISGTCGTLTSNTATVSNPITAPSTSTATGISVLGNIVTITSPVQITINGIGFTPSTNVTINGVLVPVIAVIGSNTIIAVLPVGVITSTGTVTIQVQNPNQAASTTVSITPRDATLTSTNQSIYQSTNFSIYPNPSTSGNFTIKSENFENGLIIFNAQGALVYSQKLTSNITQINANLISGIYLIKVGKVSQKLVVE